MKKQIYVLLALLTLSTVLAGTVVLAGVPPLSLLEAPPPAAEVPQFPPAAPLAVAPGPEITYYYDRPSFEADCAGLPTEDFEEGHFPGYCNPTCPHPIDVSGSGACFAPGEILPGVHFWASTTHVGDELLLLDDGCYSNATRNIYTTYFADWFEITFEPPVQCAGLDVLTAYGAGPCDIDVYGGTGLLGSDTTACSPAGNFWGVKSTSPIIEIEIEDPGPQGGEGVDNVTFGVPDGPKVFATHVRVSHRPGPGLVLGFVRIVNESLTPVPAAIVDVKWTIPPAAGSSSRKRG